jgi:glycosyltransferase involved in cell wall biosynthesis
MTLPKQIPVSVIVPVFNEEKNLARALASVSWADDVWVVDSGSTDRTVEIARAFGAQVVQFDFNGVWPKKKNWSLENLALKNEWIFLLDADEELPAEAADEIGAIIADKQSEIKGYWINRRFMFMDRWMKHAYYPNWNLRLLRRGCGRFEQLARGATDSGDNEVHEHLQVSGKSGKLSCEMLHYPFPDVATFIEKHNRYSNWEAVVAVEGGHQTEDPKQQREVDRKRLLKRWVQRLPFRPTLRFFWVYVLQRGFLDGREGFYFARLHAIYEQMTLMKIYQLHQRSKDKNSS